MARGSVFARDSLLRLATDRSLPPRDDALCCAPSQSDADVDDRGHAHPGDPANAIGNRIDAVDGYERFDAKDSVEVRLQLSNGLYLLQRALGTGHLRRPDVAGLSHPETEDRDDFRLLHYLHALVIQQGVHEVIQRLSELLDDIADAEDLDQPGDVLRPRARREREHEHRCQGDCHVSSVSHLPVSHAPPIIERRAIRYVRAHNPGGSAVTVDLVLAGNGPGELTGWIRPVARAARQRGPADLRLTLVLSPTQFAGGREVDVVKSWDLFDRVLTPAEGTRLALGARSLDVDRQVAVIHLGGDLWFSARVARRLRAPVGAFAETPLILRRHRAFARIFAASEDLAATLRAQGVPKDRLVVTGDPRVDAVLEGQRQPPSPSLVPGQGRNSPAPSRPADATGEVIVSILAGSRDRFFRLLVPYFMRAADALARARPRITFQVIAAEFLSPELIAAMQEDTRRRWLAPRVVWVTHDPWAALARSDLALAIPGTNTAELAILGVPFAVVVPLELMDRAPTEGLLEWAGRVPGVGRLIKRFATWRYFARPRLLALPNLRAGRAIVPEWIGRWTPAELANRVGELLDDAPRRAAMRTALRQVYPASGGAAGAIAIQALALAGAGKVEPS